MKLKSILCTTPLRRPCSAPGFCGGRVWTSRRESVTSLPPGPPPGEAEPVQPGYDIAQWSVSMPVMVHGTATVEEAASS